MICSSVGERSTVTRPSAPKALSRPPFGFSRANAHRLVSPFDVDPPSTILSFAPTAIALAPWNSLPKFTNARPSLENLLSSPPLEPSAATAITEPDVRWRRPATMIRPPLPRARSKAKSSPPRSIVTRPSPPPKSASGLPLGRKRATAKSASDASVCPATTMRPFASITTA